MYHSPTVTQEAGYRLLQMATTNQGDVLGYNAFFPHDDEKEEPNEHDLVLEIMELAADALSGSQPNVTRHCDAWPTLRCMTPDTAGLLGHMGIDAANALALSDALGKVQAGFEILHEGRIVVEANEVHWTVTLPGDVVWNSLGMIRIPQVPDTIAEACAGQPLSKLLSHPAIDPQGHVMQGVEEGDDGTSVIRLQQIPVPSLGVRDLRTLRRTARAS